MPALKMIGLVLLVWFVASIVVGLSVGPWLARRRLR